MLAHYTDEGERGDGAMQLRRQQKSVRLFLYTIRSCNTKRPHVVIAPFTEGSRGPCLINHNWHASLLGPFGPPFIKTPSLNLKQLCLGCTHRERTQKGKFSNRLAQIFSSRIHRLWLGRYSQLRLHGLAGRYDNLMPELTLSPSHGSLNSASGTTTLPQDFPFRPRLKQLCLGYPHRERT